VAYGADFLSFAPAERAPEIRCSAGLDFGFRPLC
jgi:hypothetical protein